MLSEARLLERRPCRPGGRFPEHVWSELRYAAVGRARFRGPHPDALGLARKGRSAAREFERHRGSRREDFLAACLTEHWGKLAAGIGLAVLSRLPMHILDEDGFLDHMCYTLVLMLRRSLGRAGGSAPGSSTGARPVWAGQDKV